LLHVLSIKFKIKFSITLSQLCDMQHGTHLHFLVVSWLWANTQCYGR